MCSSTDLVKFLDLGSMPPADTFLDHADDPEENFPLRVMSCQNCGLAQLDYVVPPEILYCNNYPYDASTAFTAQKHWKKFADDIWKEVPGITDDLVVDIGSNVGVLLQAFKDNGARVLGVDPAANITKIANANGIETITGFFNEDVAHIIKVAKGQASIITGTNVFAHVHDLDNLMKAIDSLLEPSGSFIIEMPYFVNLVKQFQYDTIYHEHLSYLSIKPLVKFFKKFNMEVYDVQEQNFHGGSIRVFVARMGVFKVSESVATLMKKEEEAGIYDITVLNKFASDVERNRAMLRNLVMTLKRSGKSIVAVSAPAKGMTLLNYCGLNKDYLDFATEKAKLKIGKFTPGTHLEVLPDNALISKKPDYALLLAWNFANEIMKNLNEFTGKFIVPIPIPRVV